MGKLPRKTVSQTYALEYGTATIEMHEDAVKPGQRVVLGDDLLATGGTVAAAARLVNQFGPAATYINFIIEIEELKGRDVLPAGIEVTSVIKV